MNSKKFLKKENISYIVAGIAAAVFMLFIVMPFAPGVQKSVAHGVLGMKAFIAHADGEGSDGGGASDGGGTGNGGSVDSNGAGGAVGGDCACGGPSGTADTGSTGGMGSSDNATPVQTVVAAAITGSISASGGACVNGVEPVTVRWSTQNAQQTVAQAAGGQYGGGQNISSGGSPSGTLTLSLPPGAYLFGVAGYNGSSWTTLQNTPFTVSQSDCTPVQTVTWTTYCTDPAHDPDPSTQYQYWQTDGQGHYRFLRPGDANCAPPVTHTCPAGYTGTYPNCTPPVQCPSNYTLQNGVCVPPTTNCPSGYTLVNGVCTPPTTNCPTGYTLVNGTCTPPTVSCPSGYTQVGNTCVPPTQNCPSGYTMQNGVCTPPTQNCPTGYTLQNGVCVPPTQTITAPVINNQNNNNNTNTNNNTNNNTVTVNTPAPSNPQIIYLPSQQQYYPPVYVPPYVQPTYNYPTCALSVSPSSITPGQVATLTWSSSYAVSGWITNVGSVNQSGSVQVSPTTSTVYTGNFVGQNGQNITCQASLNVQGYVYPVYPTNTTPYITLSAVPYTGLDLGPIGDVAYWSLLALMGLLGVYLVGVRKLHRDVAGWMQGKRKARLSF